MRNMRNFAPYEIFPLYGIINKGRQRASNYAYNQAKRLAVQHTCMVVKEYHLYPDYQLTEEERQSMKGPHIKALEKERHRKITESSKNPETLLHIEHRYFVSLSTNDAHEKVHPTKKAGGMSQRVHPIISQKIESLVKEGVIDVQEVKRHLRCYVKSEMKDHEPHESIRAYYPTNTDIQNHIDAAKAAIQFSKFDQVNLKAMVDEWSESKKAGKYFFRPFIKKESLPSEESSSPSSSTALLQQVLTLHQHVPSLYTRTHLDSSRGVATENTCEIWQYHDIS